MTDMAERVANLRRSVERQVRAAIGDKKVRALVDFPNYPNVGDSAIYLGQLACLRSLRIRRPRFICDFRTYDRKALAKAVRDGAILLTGGGSFGDLSPVAQECREDILRSFPNNRVIQLPQSLHFQRTDSLDRAKRVIGSHRNLKLFWRDERSLEMAKRNFDADSELCPDMAFCLGSLERPRPASTRIVWLLRTDKESAVTRPEDLKATIVDWRTEPGTRLLRLNYRLMGATLRLPATRFWRSLLIQTYKPLATTRLRRGLNLLSGGDVVITDRLHGHILSMLLGIPHVVLDNSYGKISSFHSAWTSGVENVQYARSSKAALELANALMK